MANDDASDETLEKATTGPEKGAEFWLKEIAAAGKVEKPWRKRADKLVDRYRDEDRENGTRLNVFWANVQLLKPAVFSATPAPDVRRREPNVPPVGRDVAQLLERALRYAIDSWGFDPPVYQVRDDMLIVGRGVSREVYEADIVKRTDIQHIPAVPEKSEIMPGVFYHQMPEREQFLLDGQPVEPEFTGEGENRRPFVEQKTDERVITRYVFWADFRMSPARCWEDVWWVAFRHAMTREELEAQFFDVDVSKVPLSITAGEHEDVKAEDAPRDPEHAFNRAEVWEVWSKSDGKRIWVAAGHDKVIRRDDDPLKLSGFFPMPRPIYAVSTTDTMVPVPEFCLYEDQANELDEVQSRIRSLTKATKAVNLIDADFSEVTSIADAVDGDNIPIQTPHKMAEDLGASIWPWPLTNISQAAANLDLRSERLKNFIYEVTGISDLMRGATKERESARAQGMKGQYGQVRMTPRSQPMHEYVRDSLRIKAEIMSEMFDASTLQRISGAPVTPEMMTMLRDEKLRNTNVEVATDSTIRPDKAAEKEEAIEYVQAVTGYLQSAMPIAQAPVVGAIMVPMLMEILKAATKPFKFGRALEETIDKTAAALTNVAGQMVQAQLMGAAMGGQPQQNAPGATPPGAGPPPNGAMQ